MQDRVILVVEDDPTLQMMVCLTLKRLGYLTRRVGSGEEALNQDFSDISMIFMDIGLPGLDGARTTMLLRENELKRGNKRVPIVALTAHSNKEQCLYAGMDDFLQKPALMADIQKMIERWMPKE